MKLERISPNKIKYSITFEELTNKGFLQDEILKDSFIWDVLFDEMLDEANRIYQLNDFGAVSIEIFSLTSKELVLILTLEEENDHSTEVEDTFLIHKDREYLLYQFDDFEHVIMLAQRITSLNVDTVESSLYAWNESYYIKVKANNDHMEGLEILCSEYGDESGITAAYLDDYGLVIIDKEAISFICQQF